MAVAAIDKGVAVTHVKTVEELKSESMIPDRLRSAVLGIFAALALPPAIGIYGVMSCSVVQRTHELAIRAALGATPARLMELVIGQGLAFANHRSRDRLRGCTPGHTIPPIVSCSIRRLTCRRGWPH